MTQQELFDKLWKSDQTEWNMRVKLCEGCNGSICKSPFLGYVLEMYYSKDSGRTLLKNVPCKYADRVQSAVRAGNRIHQHPRNISVYDE